MAVFQLLGGSCETKEEAEDPFELGSSMRIQLGRFTTLFRQVVHMYTSPEDRFLLAPARCKSHRLQPDGIFGHVACINSEICLRPDLQSEVHKALASLVNFES